MSTKFYDYEKRQCDSYGHLTTRDGGIVHQIFTDNDYNVMADDDGYGEFTLTEIVQTGVVPDVTSPILKCRNVTVVGTVAGMTGKVKVYGTDIYDNEINEEFTLAGTTAKAGNKAFKSVSKIDFPAQTTSDNTVKVGWGNKLGLKHCATRRINIVSTINGVIESTSPTFTNNATDISRNTITFSADTDFSKETVHYILS